MNCLEFRDNISYYIDNILSKDDALEFEKHMAICDECKKEYDEMLNIVKFLNDAEEVKLPNNFDDILRSNLQREKRSKNNIYKYLNIAAAIAILVTSISFMNNLDDKELSKKEEVAIINKNSEKQVASKNQVDKNKIEDTISEINNNQESKNANMSNNIDSDEIISNNKNINETKQEITKKITNEIKSETKKNIQPSTSVNSTKKEDEVTKKENTTNNIMLANIDEKPENIKEISNAPSSLDKDVMTTSEDIPKNRMTLSLSENNKIKDIHSKKGELITIEIKDNLPFEYIIENEKVLKFDSVETKGDDKNKVYLYKFKTLDVGKTNITYKYKDSLNNETYNITIGE